jgi:hypothetical protein
MKAACEWIPGYRSPAASSIFAFSPGEKKNLAFVLSD